MRGSLCPRRDRGVRRRFRARRAAPGPRVRRVLPSPPTQVTVVTDHRMAFSVSPQQTVLWDQIEYSGNPQDFAWVLPVMAGAQVQLSHDQFFAALDALSRSGHHRARPAVRRGRSGGCGCWASSSNSGAALQRDAGGGSSVQVVSQSVVGPYDTVTLHSTDPNALYDWLDANSYAVPDSMRPVIDAYVAGGFDFLALRLAPGQGVQAMQPVRVVSPGAGLTLPLRMVAAGAGAQLGHHPLRHQRGALRGAELPQRDVRRLEARLAPRAEHLELRAARRDASCRAGRRPHLAHRVLGGSTARRVLDCRAPQTTVTSSAARRSRSRASTSLSASALQRCRRIRRRGLRRR